MDKNPEVSVVVPISERHDDLKQLYHLYANELIALDRTFEFIFILDGSFSAAFEDLIELNKIGNNIRIIKFAKNFGESAALMEGFRQAKGDCILTLASYLQIEPKELGKLFAAYDEGNDLIITRRYPRKDPLINRLQSSAYHFLVRKMTGAHFKDITSGMRLINKNIIPEFNLYGDLHRFIPIMAVGKGIRVSEIKVSQRKEDTQTRFVKPGVYLRRAIDLLTLLFLIKFTIKPLRFFGLIGSAFCIPGVLISVYLVLLKLLGKTGLADRPMLLLAILFIVFGLQLFSVGLIGELILFTRSKNIENYRIEQIIE